MKKLNFYKNKLYNTVLQKNRETFSNLLDGEDCGFSSKQLDKLSNILFRNLKKQLKLVNYEAKILVKKQK